MLPIHVLQELTRRLSDERAHVMAKSVGLDPAQPLPPLNVEMFRRLEFNGTIDFYATICCQDQAQAILCRLTFTCNLRDGIDPDTGRSIRIVGEAADTIHALIATGEKEPAFEWVSLHRHFLPAAALAKLDDKVEQLAVIMEDGRPRR